VTSPPRPLLRRLGIVALNIPAPGLGLLRLARFRAAIFFLVLPPIAMLFLLAYYAAAPTPSLAGYVLTMAVLLLATAVALFGSGWMSWKASAASPEQRPVWSRWYVLLAVWICMTVVSSLFVDVMHRFYRPFYLPSEGMAPTLLKYDRLIASMQGPGPLRRGDIILFAVNHSVYIKRVAALPGDRIAFRKGQVILNGAPVAQRLLGIDRGPHSWGIEDARRLAERFPGEGSEHQIYDLGETPVDDMIEVEVRPGHVFVLGDNRDRSADSRVAREEAGVEQLPIGDISGRALFYGWGSSHRLGEPLNR
jgi:signal peptidase I